MLKKIAKSGEYTHMFIIMITVIIYYFTPSISIVNAIPSSTEAAPFGSWIQQQLNAFPVLAKPLSILFIITISILVNRIALSSEINPRQSFLAASLFPVLMLFTASSILHVNILIVIVLLVFSFGNIMNIFGKFHPYQEIFNASFAIAIAAMIAPVTIVFILFIWFSFFTYSINSWREWIISLIALILPFVYLMFAYFWYDNLNLLLAEYSSWANNLSIKYTLLPTDRLISLALLILLITLSMLKFTGDASDKIISIRKKMWITFQFSMVCIIAVLLTGYSYFTTLPLIFVPLSIMLSYSVHNLKRSRLYDILVTLLIISIMVNRLTV